MFFFKKKLSDPKVILSVIVPNYNNEPYIRECIESILNQSFQDYEIIISDDCSTDRSIEIIKEYEKKYPGKIKVLYGSTNRGVSRNRHEAILYSTAPYITTIDSDDYYYDSIKLEKEMELIMRYKNKENRDVIAFSNIAIVNEDKTLMFIWGTTETIREGDLLSFIMGRSCMIPRDFIMSREAYLNAGGYDMDLPIYEDWDLKIRLAARYPYYYTGNNGTAYRRHGKGLSSRSISEHILSLNQIYRKNSCLIPLSHANEISKSFNAFINILNQSNSENCNM